MSKKEPAGGMTRKRKKAKKRKTRWPMVMKMPLHASGQKRFRAFAVKRFSKKHGYKRWTASVRKMDSERAREMGIGGMLMGHCMANGLTKPLECPVLVEALVIFEKPKSHLRATKPETWSRKIHTSKPDADNIMKAIKDAGNGIVWKDDSQVVPVGPIKLYGAKDWRGNVVEEDCLFLRIRPVTYDFLRKRIERFAGPDPCEL